MKKQLIISLALLMAGAAQLSAQGIIINKTDGTFDFYPAEQIESITTYGYGEEPQPQPGEDGTLTFTVGDVSFKMVSVEGGTFEMGFFGGYSTESSSARPTHQVTLSSFSIGQTEVTQALWYAVMGLKPTADGNQWTSGRGLGDNFPAYYVSWEDCQEFITKLNVLTGQQFRLPTEAEWEFAARGGTKSKGYEYAGSDDLGEVGWYELNSKSDYAPRGTDAVSEVASMKPNELDLYDMSGNASEWCQDWYGSYTSEAQTNPTGPETGTYRVCRGGSWLSEWDYCEVWCRDYYKPTSRDAFIGLRLALNVSTQ